MGIASLGRVVHTGPLSRPLSVTGAQIKGGAALFNANCMSAKS